MTHPSRRPDGGLLASLPVSDRAKAELRRRMDAPARHYHTMRHLDLLWDRHLQYGAAANLRDSLIETPIALAIAYHDSVYVGGATDNEERSAAFWLEVSAADGGVDAADRLWVAETIRATAAHVEAPRDIDGRDLRGLARQWVLDLDLTPLGEAPDVFDDNMRRLGAELPDLSEPRRHDLLVATLRRFAAARPLYRCAPIAAAFEPRARANLARHLRDAIGLDAKTRR